MQSILARSQLDVLLQFTSSNVLMAFDFDGTLAPIVDDPADAAMRPQTRALLEQVARRYPCVVLSGRSRADLGRRLRGIPLAEILGNHGAEPSGPSGALLQQVSAWLPSLTARLAPEQGVVIENKHYSIAVHYRRARNRQRAREAIADAVGRLQNIRCFGGKLVVNLVPEGAPHKGSALSAARDRLRCDTAVYVGDDESDEDVFGLDEPGRLLGIRVGEDSESRAAFYVPDQGRIDELLRHLVEARVEPERPRRGSVS